MKRWSSSRSSARGRPTSGRDATSQGRPIGASCRSWSGSCAGDPTTLRVKSKPLPFLAGRTLEQKVRFSKLQAYNNGSAGIVFVVDTGGRGLAATSGSCGRGATRSCPIIRPRWASPTPASKPGSWPMSVRSSGRWASGARRPCRSGPRNYPRHDVIAATIPRTRLADRAPASSAPVAAKAFLEDRRGDPRPRRDPVPMPTGLRPVCRGGRVADQAAFRAGCHGRSARLNGSWRAMRPCRADPGDGTIARISEGRGDPPTGTSRPASRPPIASLPPRADPCPSVPTSTRS